MTRAVLAGSLVLLTCLPAWGTPIRTAEYAQLPPHDGGSREDGCALRYYNYCSGWTWYWSFYWTPNPLQIGTCFDLSDCPAGCRHLSDVWWAYKWCGPWMGIDLEVYCADDYACPVGPPLAGLYGMYLWGSGWRHFVLPDLALCPCEELGFEKFIVLISFVRGYEDICPYSDTNPRNMETGCETEWRCTGHSYIYRMDVSYCDVYGMPAPMWLSGATYGCTDPPAVPPGLDEPGLYVEWLLDCELRCLGPTSVERESWSNVKTLFR